MPAAAPWARPDPTGLFVLKGDCPNWGAAFAEAKRLVGCGKGAKQTECLYQIIQQAGCSICQFLEDGLAPDAYVKTTLGQAQAHTNVGAPGAMYNQAKSGYAGEFASQMATAHPEANSIAVAQGLCSGAGKITGFARILIEEASHYCASKTGKPFPDPQAGSLAGSCVSWGGCAPTD